MGIKVMGHNWSLFKALIPGKLPIYLGMNVDNILYYSISDDVEELFEQGLQSKIKMDLVGTVSWICGQAYEQYTTRQT